VDSPDTTPAPTGSSSATAVARYESLAGEPLAPATGSESASGRLWANRQLLGQLIRRELKVRYKDSSLGFLWSLLRPLSLLVVYYVAIGQFLGAQRSIPAFAIFIFTGLTLWALFSEIVGGGTGSIVANSGLVKKVYLPREIFPLSIAGSALFNFAIMLVVLISATIVAGQVPTGPRLAYVPLSLIALLPFALALGIVFSAANVYLRDIQYLVEIGLMVLFWASPIVYSWDLVQGVLADHPWAQELYLANPVTLAVLGFQRALWVAGDATATYPPNLAARLLACAGVSLILLWLARRFFARLQGNFAQEL
jgi:ABC-2 type transport system permease protein